MSVKFVVLYFDTSSHGALRHQTPSPRDLHFTAHCAHWAVRPKDFFRAFVLKTTFFFKIFLVR